MPDPDQAQSRHHLSPAWPSCGQWTYSFPGAGTAWACWQTCPAAGAWAGARRCSQTACRSWQSGAWTASETERLLARLCAFWGWLVRLRLADSLWTVVWMDSAKVGLERAPLGSYKRKGNTSHAPSPQNLCKAWRGSSMSFFRQKTQPPLHSRRLRNFHFQTCQNKYFLKRYPNIIIPFSPFNSSRHPGIKGCDTLCPCFVSVVRNSGVIPLWGEHNSEVIPLWGEHRHLLEAVLMVTTGKVPLASSGWRPGMLLAILQCIVWPPPPTMIQLKTSVEPRLRNHGGETKNTTSSRHNVTTDRARMPQTLATFCGNMRSTLDTGNLEVWRRVWGHQHRSPLGRKAAEEETVIMQTIIRQDLRRKRIKGLKEKGGQCLVQQVGSCQ